MRLRLLPILLPIFALGCTGTVFEFREHVGYTDTVTGCPRYAHAVRGPDDYDIAHGRPYHCEAPAVDLDNIDIDMVDQ